MTAQGREPVLAQVREMDSVMATDSGKEMAKAKVSELVLAQAQVPELVREPVLVSERELASSSGSQGWHCSVRPYLRTPTARCRLSVRQRRTLDR